MLDGAAEAAGALLAAADLLGTFVFALSGAVLAIRKDLDVFGIVVLAAAAAFGGGMLRDVLIGAGPPIALLDARYLVVAVVAAGLVAVLGHRLDRVDAPVKYLDAGGLALFAVTGTRIALDAGLPALAAVVLGVLTAVGGGILRDLLGGEVPLVLRREVYALAALLGAGIVAGGDLLGLPADPTAVVAGVGVLVLRVLAIARRWEPPRGRGAGHG